MGTDLKPLLCSAFKVMLMTQSDIIVALSFGFMHVRKGRWWLYCNMVSIVHYNVSVSHMWGFN